MSYNFGNAITIFKETITKQYWDVDGRTSRSDFWHFYSISFLASLVLSIPGYILPVLGIISTIFSLAILAPTIGIGIRRVHDQGKAWWHFLIPFYNLYLFCMPGDKGSNEFGEDPLGGTAETFS